jgi:hypothetical protein
MLRCWWGVNPHVYQKEKDAKMKPNFSLKKEFQDRNEFYGTGRREIQRAALS